MGHDQTWGLGHGGGGGEKGIILGHAARRKDLPRDTHSTQHIARQAQAHKLGASRQKKQHTRMD